MAAFVARRSANVFRLGFLAAATLHDRCEKPILFKSQNSCASTSCQGMTCSILNSSDVSMCWPHLQQVSMLHFCASISINDFFKRCEAVPYGMPNCAIAFSLLATLPTFLSGSTNGIRPATQFGSENLSPRLGSLNRNTIKIHSSRTCPYAIGS